MDEEFDNFETGLEACLKVDGTNAPEADFEMAGYRHTNVGAAVSTNQYLRLDQFQKLTPIFARFGGTAEAISASTTPSFTALVTGHTVLVSCPSANASSATLNVNAISAYPIRNVDGTALANGAVKGLHQYVFTGTEWVLMNTSQGGTVDATTTFTELVTFTSAVVFSGSASFTSATIYDGVSQRDIGYRDVPVVTVDSGRTLSVGDRSKMLYHATSSASQLLVPSSANVAFPIGTVLILQNGPSSGVVSVSAAGDTATLYRVGTGSTGTRFMSANAQMTLAKVASDTWYITGVGVL